VIGNRLNYAVGLAGLVLCVSGIVRIYRTAIAAAYISTPGYASGKIEIVPRRFVPADSTIAFVADNDPFRLSNEGVDSTSAIVASGAANPTTGNTARLTVRGIIGGPPWAAIIDGVPGKPPGTVVHVGDVFAAVRIRSIRARAVVVTTKDSTLTLTLAQNDD
jgi:hypothetical protein